MRTPTKDQQGIAQKLIGKDQLEMTDTERDLFLAPYMLDQAEKEISRLRELVIRLAKNELSEAQKKILLSD